MENSENGSGNDAQLLVMLFVGNEGSNLNDVWMWLELLSFPESLIFVRPKDSRGTSTAQSIIDHGYVATS